ncbi:hypothetical protein [Haloarcula rubripromontorii]|nr:hypothetical protein [Haloarcula rubripromontorii]
MGVTELRTAFKQSLNSFTDDVDWVCTSNPDDPAGEMTGEEDFDVILHLNTTDLERARELVGNAGEQISERGDWDQKLRFNPNYGESPEVDMSVRVYLTPESREGAGGTELHF